MQPKNIECIKHLLHLAIVDGDYLGDSWFAVLDSISQLGRLQLLSTGLTDDSFFNNVGSDHGGMHTPTSNKRRNKSMSESPNFHGSGGIMSSASSSFSSSSSASSSSGHDRRNSTMSGVAKFFYGPTRAETTRLIEEANAAIVNESIDASKVDHVFSASTRLSSSAIQDFVKALCLVSLKELQVQVGHAAASPSSASQGRPTLPQAFSTFRVKDR
jgi:brefeldin A-inhibited guanine nucleotide-exchange protein